ncbi:hypothetical protein DOTSEDRAFT_25732 [Dothistroma septosporum NZE10]|uniref:Uncharacterized protein n=1 Tax=Dothistroma septosporum (strain NZE10 / CBS 128990) TaxID=675120 RepID=N1PKK0_DOTSN|nr:hypothetical protein DOTSEDRAFT_25732 [Dothistroma septosporum NZE10]
METPTLRRHGLSEDAITLADILLFTLKADYGTRASPRQAWRQIFTIQIHMKMLFAVVRERGLKVPLSSGYGYVDFTPMLHRPRSNLGFLYTLREICFWDTTNQEFQLGKLLPPSMKYFPERVTLAMPTVSRWLPKFEWHV